MMPEMEAGGAVYVMTLDGPSQRVLGSEEMTTGPELVAVNRDESVGSENGMMAERNTTGEVTVVGNYKGIFFSSIIPAGTIATSERHVVRIAHARADQKILM
jgi:hypothetical protein